MERMTYVQQLASLDYVKVICSISVAVNRGFQSLLQSADSWD